METPKEIVVYLTQIGSYCYLPYFNLSQNSIFDYQEYRLPSTLTEKAIDECVKYVQTLGQKCVLPFTDDTTTVAAVINKRLGYPYPSLASQIYCSNKLLTRKLVDDFEWYYGFNLDEPLDSILAVANGRPCMLKSTMLVAGAASYRCDNTESFRTAIQTIYSNKEHVEKVKSQHDEFVKIVSEDNEEIAKRCTQYMIEELIQIKDTGIHQYCIEAIVTKEGKVIPYSFTEEFQFKNGMFLGDITPPVHWEGSLQACEDYIIQIGRKLYEIGFQNQMFNIEFWKFPNGKFQLVEINPRIGTPYFYLHKVYCGSHLIDDVTNLVIHGKEPVKTPFSKLKEEWPISQYNSSSIYTLNVNLTTRAVGKATDVFDYKVIDEMLERQGPLLLRTPRDVVLTKMDKTYVGTSMVQAIVQGSWNHVVTQAKDLRKKFYKDLSQCEESSQYPDYFNLV